MPRELAGFKTSKGTVNFTPDKPIPPELVTKLVKARIAENEAGRCEPSRRACAAATATARSLRCHPSRVAPTTRTVPAGTPSSPHARRLISSRPGAGANAPPWPASRRIASWWRTAAQIQGVAQVLIRKGAFGRQIAYVPHGPVWDRSAPNADRIFAWLAQGLRSLALKEKALVVKMDPRNEPGQDFDFSHLAAEHDLQPAQDLQAPTTRIVDLLDGGEELEASWHADARRLSKRAAREGTEVTISREPDEAEVSVLHDLLADVAEHADFRVRSPEFLMRLATEFAASGGWYLGIARVEGTPIAAMAFPRVGDRAYYLYGALRRDEQYKHNYGSHAVMAEMLRTLAADGVKTVDMWGVVEPDDETRQSGLEGLQRLQAHLRRRAAAPPGPLRPGHQPLLVHHPPLRPIGQERLARPAPLSRCSRIAQATGRHAPQLHRSGSFVLADTMIRWI